MTGDYMCEAERNESCSKKEKRRRHGEFDGRKREVEHTDIRCHRRTCRDRLHGAADIEIDDQVEGVIRHHQTEKSQVTR